MLPTLDKQWDIINMLKSNAPVDAQHMMYITYITNTEVDLQTAGFRHSGPTFVRLSALVARIVAASPRTDPMMQTMHISRVVSLSGLCWTLR